MARDASVNLNQNAWTELTADDATKIAFMNMGGSQIRVRGSTSSTAPSDLGGYIYSSGEGERGVTLADFFPGISAVRVFAWTSELGQKVFVSHD